MSDTTEPNGHAPEIAEYAMGLLGGPERAVLEARLAGDPALRAELADWQERLAALADEVAPVNPPERVYAGLEQRLFGEEIGAGFFARLFGARRGAVAGVALSFAVLLALIFWLPGAQSPLYVSQLAAEDSPLEMSAQYSRDGTLQLARLAGEAPEGRVLELWLIVGDKPAISLGVLPDAPKMALNLPDEYAALMAPGAVLAITDEPFGGAPGGIATGSVRALGEVQAF
ncbi:MAG: anti-sigma factor [Paracoccaceae bacterium]